MFSIIKCWESVAFGCFSHTSTLFVNPEWGRLDWNGLARYFFLYFHFSRWLENCFEERDMEKAEKMPPPECLWHSRLHKIWFLSRQIQISAATNPDFRGNKSWRLREKSGLMLMQGKGQQVAGYSTCSKQRWSMEDDTDALSKRFSQVWFMSAIFIL